MFLPLLQCQTPPKQWNCTSPAPPACHTLPPYYPLSRPPVFGWLLRLKLLTGGHLRSRCILYYIYFVGQFAAPSNRMVFPHMLPAQHASALTPPPTSSADYWVDCCLKSPNGGHLRPEPGAPLYLCPIPMLQLTEPATARAHKTIRASFRPIGIGNTKI